MSQHHPSTLRLALAAITTLAACNNDSVTPPVATSMAVLNGNAITGVVGTALSSPIVVQVMDQNGNAMANTPVTFVPTATSGVVSTAVVLTDANGTASVTWTLGTAAGIDTLTIGANGIASTDVTASATPDAPANLVVVSGAGQAATVGSTLSIPLAVQATDRYGNPTPNVTVQWADDANGTFAASTEVTNQSGIAQNTYTLGPTPGTEDIDVTVPVASGVITAAFTEMGS